jgi:hypothetical protein
MSEEVNAEILELLSQRETLQSILTRLDVEPVVAMLEESLKHSYWKRKSKKLLKEIKRLQPNCSLSSLEETPFGNATSDQLPIYDEVLQELQMFQKKNCRQKISPVILEVIKRNVNSLCFYHKHNVEICAELGAMKRSNLYDREGYPALHTYSSEETIQMAGNLFSILESSFLFAREHNCLHSFFTLGLAKRNGCLEAVYRELQHWFIHTAT